MCRTRQEIDKSRAVKNATMDYFFHDRIEIPKIPDVEVADFGTKVIVIGAGVAGLMAANVLKKLGVKEYLVLEASSDFGGRIHRSNDFGDIPIDLGAEIVHMSPDVGSAFVKDILVFDQNFDMDMVEFHPKQWQFGKHRRDFLKYLDLVKRGRGRSG